MRYPDNPPHDRPGSSEVGDRPVTDTRTLDPRARAHNLRCSGRVCSSDNIGSSLSTTSAPPRSGHLCGSGHDRNRRHRIRTRSARGRGPPERGLWWNAIRQLLLRLAHCSGTAVLLAAILTGVGAALGLSQNVETAGTTTAGTESVGLVGGIVLLAIIFVAYLAGGYVAGRMARFNGLKQGLGVWLWSVLIAIIAAAAGLLAGARFDVLARVNSFPRLRSMRDTDHRRNL